MKKLPTFLTFCMLHVFMQAQSLSYNGQSLTPKGSLHVLIVFVGFDTTTNANNLPSWDHDKIPDWAMGDFNNLIDYDGSQIHDKKNLTSYFATMSQDSFIVTGEVYPNMIMIDPEYDPIYDTSGAIIGYSVKISDAFTDARDIINTQPNATFDYDWSRFDNRTNSPNYLFDNSLYSDTSGTPAGPDEKIDYIVFVARITGGSGFNGFDNPGVGGYLVNGVDSFAISRGHAFTTAVDSYESFMHTFWHEMMHTVFRAPHTWTVNGVVGDYYYSYDGWGFMAPFPAMDCANSWERWWLNWITPQEITTNGTYTLKDYLEEGDALRIKIPEINAIETDQYLYLENHQMINYWDRKPAYTAESEALSAGVYGFIAAKGHDRSLPISTSNPYANMFKSLNAEGRFDFITIGETEVYGVGAPGDKQKIFQKTVSNPISGQGDFERIRADHDSTGIIEVADGSNRQGVGSTIDTYNDTWLFAAESDGVTSSPTYSFTGDADLAFQVGDEISLSGILPALNYPQYHGTPDGTTDYLDPYYLNGLKV